MQLSERLKKVISFVSPCETVADIGTDHGYVPIMLVKNGIVKKAYAMDVNKGPLQRAAEHVAEEGLEDRIELRLSNGLQKLQKKEAESIVIAGMGGELMVDILESGKEVLEDVKELILSPHSEIGVLRKYLINSGYEIIQEEMLYDAGKYYTILKVIHSQNPQKVQEQYKEEYYYIYGLLLIQKKDSVLKEFLEKKQQKYIDIYEHLKLNSVTDTVEKRMQEMKAELEEIEMVLENLKCHT